jgi:threonine dehydrogenase-like Zn-dependent dehydrogenase
MGHEFAGIVVSAGSEVKTVVVGDKVVAPFTVSCGQCFYCQGGFSSRCVKSALFGSTGLDGGQAEYVRVPLADGTVMKAPAEIDDKALVLMADIFPTGFFGARNAFAMLAPQKPQDAVVVVIGCGPVGLCAIVAALDYQPKHVFAVDSIDSRLELAKSLGAEPLNFLRPGMHERIKEVTDGRGADAVIEVVGLSPALRTGFELLRPWGAISSIGVHNAEVSTSVSESPFRIMLIFRQIPWTGAEAYG